MAGISFLKQRRIIFISIIFFERSGVDLRENWYWEFAKFLVMRFLSINSRFSPQYHLYIFILCLKAVSQQQRQPYIPYIYILSIIIEITKKNSKDKAWKPDMMCFVTLYSSRFDNQKIDMKCNILLEINLLGGGGVPQFNSLF